MTGSSVSRAGKQRYRCCVRNGRRSSRLAGSKQPLSGKVSQHCRTFVDETMAPRKKLKISVKKVLEEKVHSYNLQKTEKKALSESEEDVAEEKNPVSDKHGKNRTASETDQETEEDHMGGEVQNMLERFGADISKVLLAKRKRLETYTKASLKTSNQKIETVLKTQQEERLKLSNEYSQQFLTLFEQWDADAQKAEEQEEKITNMFCQQQKLFQQSRIVQNHRLKTMKQMYEQYLKSSHDLEKSHGNLLTGAQNELRKEMALLQKKILMDTQQQEMASVRKSLQSMLF